jgi:serine/threonine protein kinase
MPKIPLPPAESMQLDSLAEVARGGMGSVELARVRDGRLVGQVLAVKRLHPNIAEDPDFVSMFLDEAWMTAALKHPNVAQVVAWGNDDKGMFLASELVQGVSLSRLLKEAQLNKEAFAERTVAFICSQICGALVAAHTLAAPDGTPLGLVHRDLTPANVLVSFDGLVKIIDFGIAKAEERISHTRTGQLKGKPAYMAPEQQRGGAVDARADIFSFGVVMYELLAGRRPWTAKGAFDVMMEISNDPHPDLGELRRGLNPEFVAIAHRCLMKKADDRFADAGAIKALLDAWLLAKGFTSDDQQSLANFVLRNSQPQVLWWKEALRGEHSKTKAPTFKELEERIDEEREKAAKAARKAVKAPPPPGAAVRGTAPMQAFGGAEPPPESITMPRTPAAASDPVRDDVRSTRMGIGPSSLVAASQHARQPGVAALYAAQPSPMVAGAAQGAFDGRGYDGRASGPPSSQAQSAEQAPAASQRQWASTTPMGIAPEIANLPRNRPNMGGTIAIVPPPDSGPKDASPRPSRVPLTLYGPGLAGVPIVPNGAPVAGASAPSAFGPGPSPSSGQQPSSSSHDAGHAPSAPSAPAAARGRSVLTLLMVTLLLVAVGAGAWFVVDRFVIGPGDGAPKTHSAPAKGR